jgi:acyl-coenzyme A thioesterase PaaI-like protein
VHGGLLAALIDCHAMATAAAAASAADGSEFGAGLLPRFVTAALQVNHAKPTPLGPVLELVGRPEEVTSRKVWVRVSLRDHPQIMS